LSGGSIQQLREVKVVFYVQQSQTDDTWDRQISALDQNYSLSAGRRRDIIIIIIIITKVLI